MALDDAIVLRLIAGSGCSVVAVYICTVQWPWSSGAHLATDTDWQTVGKVMAMCPADQQLTMITEHNDNSDV